MTSLEDTNNIEVMVKGLKITDDDDANINDAVTVDNVTTPPNTPSDDHWLNYRHEKVGDLGVYVMNGKTNTHDVIRDLVRNEDLIDIERPIFCTNLDDVIEHYRLWTRELPNVEVFYAMKTYDSPVMLQLLHNLGCGFEIASKTEGDHCLNLGIAPEKIICNHPYKLGPHLQHFAVSKIRILSVDSPDELDKMASIYPEADLLVRIIPAADYFEDGFHFDVKFGATEAQAQELLQKGRRMGLNFVGVAFHVGSATKDDTVHERSLELSRRLFDFAKSLGYDFHILDIGGGFPGGAEPLEFEKICGRLRPAIARLFTDDMAVRIVAEPGRFFATSAVTAYASVVGRRQVAKCKLNKAVCHDDVANLLSDPDALDSYVYILNDGVWGSMNYILAENDYQPLEALKPNGSELAPCIIWGPTCDSLDRLTSVYNMEVLNVGDWVYRRNGGAYAHTIRTTFNGMPQSRYIFTIREENLHILNQNGGIKMPYV